MVDELRCILGDCRTYRFTDPGWTPGTTNRVSNDPEAVQADWEAFRISVLMPDEFPKEEIFRDLTRREYDTLVKDCWWEIWDAIRLWARTGEVRET